MAIFTAIGVAIAGALFGGSILAATIISGVLAFGVQLAISYLTRPKARTYGANKGEREFGARVSAWALYGTGKVKGHHIYYAKWGSGNKYNADVFVLSNGWCDGLEPEIYFYGKKHNLVARSIIGNEAAHYGVESYGSLISIRFYDGRPGQGVDTKLVTDTASIGMEWKSTSVCAGLCYVVVERRWDEDKFDKGHPDFEFVLRGLRLYDPRKDGTVAGGAGAHRINDSSTWEFSKNPALQRLNYQIGLKGLISQRTLVGEGKTLGQLDLASYFTAMNVCDALREGKATYQCAIFVTGDDDHTEILKEFDDAMAGYGMNRRGLSGVIAGAPQLSVYAIGADDIDAGRPKSKKRRKSAFEIYNHISGQFTSPASNWNAESLVPITVNQDVADDGRVRQTSNDFLQVADPDIAQYLLQIRYRQNRKGGSATLPVSRRCGFAVTEGEWVTYDGLTWLITGWQCDENLEFTLTLGETGSDVYSSDGIEPGPVVLPPPVPVNPSLLTTVAGFAVEVGMVQGEDGFEIPSLRFTWTPPDDPTITAVRFFYGPIGGTEIFEVQSTDVESGELITTANVVSGKFYQARATITTVPDRFKTYTAWYNTLEPTGRTKVSVQLDGLSVGVKAQLADLRRASDNIRSRLETLALAATDMATQASQGQSIAVRFRDATASALQELNVAVSEFGATAEAVTALQATVGDAGGGALWRMVVSAGEGEVVSRITLQVRATVGDEWVAASTIWEAGMTGGTPFGRIVLSALQTMIADDEGNVLALFDEDGVHLSNAFIANLTGDHIAFNTLTGEHIVVGSIDSPSLAFGAVTDYGDLNLVSTYNYGNSTSLPATGYVTIATATLDNSEGNLVLESFNMTLTHSLSGSGTIQTGARVVRNGVVLFTLQNLVNDGGVNATPTYFNTEGDINPVYEIQITRFATTGASTTASVVLRSRSGVLCWKR